MKHYFIKMGNGLLNILSNKKVDNNHIDKNNLYKSHLLLSDFQTLKIIDKLLDNKETVISNLCDRNGPVYDKIISIEGKTVITEKKHHLTLSDNFLYNIHFDNKNNVFNLEEHDEYYEEIPV